MAKLSQLGPYKASHISSGRFGGSPWPVPLRSRPRWRPWSTRNRFWVWTKTSWNYWWSVLGRIVQMCRHVESWLNYDWIMTESCRPSTTLHLSRSFKRRLRIYWATSDGENRTWVELIEDVMDSTSGAQCVGMELLLCLLCQDVPRCANPHKTHLFSSGLFCLCTQRIDTCLRLQLEFSSVRAKRESMMLAWSPSQSNNCRRRSESSNDSGLSCRSDTEIP